MWIAQKTKSRNIEWEQTHFYGANEQSDIVQFLIAVDIARRTANAAHTEQNDGVWKWNWILFWNKHGSSA